jgi:hypothetical protein
MDRVRSASQLIKGPLKPKDLMRLHETLTLAAA